MKNHSFGALLGSTISTSLSWPPLIPLRGPAVGFPIRNGSLILYVRNIISDDMSILHLEHLILSSRGIGPNCVLRLAHSVRLWAREPEFLV